VKKLLKSIYTLLVNNALVNNFAVITGLDSVIPYPSNNWKLFQYDDDKSQQENAGFSHRKDVDEAITKVKDDLKAVAQNHLKAGDAVLDIGCGPGIYLRELYGLELDLNGIDISEDMVSEAQKNLPQSSFLVGNILTQPIDKKFHLIYSISMIEYIRPSRLRLFYHRIAQLLHPGGVVFIQYPHALSKKDTLFPDMTYVKYSTRRMQKTAEEFFDIVEHHQSWDGRTVEDYDTQPYPSENGTFKNGYLLVGKKW